MIRLVFLAVLLLLPMGIHAECVVVPYPAGHPMEGNFAIVSGGEDLFVDAENHDFHLKPGSCAVDRGATISEVETDFDGVKRPSGKWYDIGAFELIQKAPLESPEGFKVE